MSCHRALLFIFSLYIFLFVTYNLANEHSNANPPPLQIVFSIPHKVGLVNITNPREFMKTITVQNSHPVSLDYLFEDSTIFYNGDSYSFSKDNLDNKVTSIKMYNMKTNKTVDLLGQAFTYIKNFAVDWIGRKLYWINDSEKLIEVIDLKDVNKLHRKVLFHENLNNLDAIVVDPINRYLFWTRNGPYFTIERCGLDGSDRIVIYRDVVGQTHSRRHLYLDYESNRLFWINQELKDQNIISSVKLDGSDREDINLRSNKLTYMTLFHGRIYFNNYFSIQSFQYEPLNTTVTNIYTIPNMDVFSLKIIHPSLQPKGTINPCHDNNGGCSDLCLLAPNPPFYRCLCPTGIVIFADNKTCPFFPSKMLIVTRKCAIYRLSLDIDLPVLVLIYRMEMTSFHLVRIDFDPLEKKIYWVEKYQRTVNRADLNGKNYQLLVTVKSGKPEGIAVDWVAGNLYWSLAGELQIWVSRLDGRWPRCLISNKLPPSRLSPGINTAGSRTAMSSSDVNNGRGLADPPPGAKGLPHISGKKRNDDSVPIVVDPINRLLFFNLRHEAEAMLEKSWLDGSHREKLKSKDIRWLNGLAIQPDTRTLYYAEAMDKHIGYVAYNRSQSGRLLDLVNGHPFGFTVMDGYAYWTDWNLAAIQRIPLGGKWKETVLVAEDVYFMDIKAIDLTKKIDIDELDNPCVSSKNPCSHFCFSVPTPINFSCGCPANQDVTKDGLHCHRPPRVLYYLMKNQIGRVNLNMSGFSAMPGWSNKIFSPKEIEQNDIPPFSKSIQQIFVPLTGLKDVMKLTIDERHERFIWYDETTQMLSSSFLNGSDPKVILSGCRVQAMDYDWISANLYLICSTNAIASSNIQYRLEVLSLRSTLSRTSDTNYARKPANSAINNEFRRTVLKTWKKGLPSVIMVQPMVGKLFWFYCHSTYLELYEANLDGSQERVLLKQLKRDNNCPEYAKIDFEEGNGIIYYFSILSTIIDIYDINTGFKSTILMPKGSLVSALEIFGDYIYISEYSTKSIYRIAKDSSNNGEDGRKGIPSNFTQILMIKMNFIYQLIVVYPNRQPSPLTDKSCAISPPLKLSLDDTSHVASLRHTILPSVCDSICVEKNGKAQCLCPPHYQLLSDGRSCTSPSKYLIAVLSSGKIIRISTADMSKEPPDVLLPFSLPPIQQTQKLNLQPYSNRASPYQRPPEINLNSAVWDPVNGFRFFYLTPDSKYIQSFNFETGHHAKLLSKPRDNSYDDFSRGAPYRHDSLEDLSPINAYSLAYEPVTKILFWSLPKSSVIVAGKTDPFKILGPIVNTSLMHSDNRKPLHVAVIVKSGYIIWTSARPGNSTSHQNIGAGAFKEEDWKDFQIERCQLDGYRCKTIVHSQNVGQVAAMVVDSRESTDTLYWIDQSKQAIYRKNIWDNKIPTKLVDPALSYAKRTPKSLVIHGNHLFWYDGQLKQASINSSSTGTPNAPVPLHGLQLITSRIVALLSIDLDPNITCDLTVRHPCSSVYAGCSHFCLPLESYPYGTPPSLCQRARGNPQALSRIRHDEERNYKCACPQGLILASGSYLDCQRDHSCPRQQLSCPRGVRASSPAFSLYRGFCLPIKYRCDGHQDCEDGADEQNCHTYCNSPNEYRCSDNTCISLDKYCNGVRDCDSDETCCGDKYFACHQPAENRCQLQSVRCNNYRDCSDGSDEADCPKMAEWPNVITIDTHSRTAYTVAIAMAVLGVVLTFGVAGYTCTKRRHRHPYVMRADQVDIMLMPTNEADNDGRSVDSPPASPDQNHKAGSRQSEPHRATVYSSDRHFPRNSNKMVKTGLSDNRRARHNRHKLSISRCNSVEGDASCIKSNVTSACKHSTLTDYMSPHSNPSRDHGRSHCVTRLPYTKSRSYRSGESELSGVSSHRQQECCDEGGRGHCCSSERQRPSGTSSSSSFTNLIQNLGSGKISEAAADIYPQETLNPPPSPITEVSYDVAPVNSNLEFSNWWYGHHYTSSSLATAVACCFPDDGEANDVSYKHQSFTAAAYSSVTHHSHNRVKKKRYKAGRSRCQNVRVLIVTTDAPPPTPHSASHYPSSDEEEDDPDPPINHPCLPLMTNLSPSFDPTIDYLPSPPPPPPPPSSTSTVYGPLLSKSKRKRHHHHHHHRVSGSSSNAVPNSLPKRKSHHHRHHKSLSSDKKANSHVSSENQSSKPLPPPPSPENESE